MGGILPLHRLVWWLQTNLLTNYINKISEDKCRYFKCNFDEKTNYAHNFEEKHVLLWCYKDEINDGIIRRKEIDIYGKFKFFFFIPFHLAKIWYAKCKRLPFNLTKNFHKNCSIQDRLSLLISERLEQFQRKLIKNQYFFGYANMLMIYINLLVHGDIQKFTKETVFCNCYWSCTDATMVGKCNNKIMIM